MLNALALKLIAGVGALLLLVILVQDRNHWKAKSVTLTAQLNEISSKRNEQKTITKTKIVEIEKARKVADDKARRVEAAPLPGQCQTPQEILQADI